MENFKFILVSLIVLLAVGFLGYWAVKTMEPSDVHVAKEKVTALEAENADLAKQVADLQSQVASLQAAQTAQTAQTSTQTPDRGVGLDEKPLPTPTTTSKYQSLENDLQKLADQKVYMKVGSQGTRVGTVETFLNIYFKTSKKIDNDYGASVKASVASFQKAQGLTADGQTGPTTYLKMIAWLKNHS